MKEVLLRIHSCCVSLFLFAGSWWMVASLIELFLLFFLVLFLDAEGLMVEVWV